MKAEEIKVTLRLGVQGGKATVTLAEALNLLLERVKELEQQQQRETWI